MYKIVGKKNFTLLEVLIAFLLIVIAAVPLLAPYPIMFKNQKKFTQDLEQDRLASIYFVDLLAKILKKEIDPAQGGIRPIPTNDGLPYTANYIFEENQVKITFLPKSGKTPTSFTYYLKGANDQK